MTMLKTLIALGLFLGTQSVAEEPKATAFTIQKLDGLSIADCTHLFNEYTAFQVYCEAPLAYDLPKNHHIDLNQINRDTDLRTIEAIVWQDPAYSVTATGNTVRIFYNHVPIGDANPLNHVLPEFAITNGDLVDIFSALRKEVPTLVLFHPLHMGWTPDLPPTEFDHQTFGGQKTDLRLTHSTVRDVLNQAIFSQTNRMYWISQYGSQQTVYVSLHSENEHLGRRVIQDHDPETQERIRQAQEQWDKEWEENQGRQPKQ